MPMRNSQILGIGRHIPPQVVTNDDLATVMDTTDDWIQQRTGIRERHFSEDNVGAADMGAAAAREALASAGLAPADIDCIIFATLSPDVDMPASACLLQQYLGIDGVPAFDIRNQCSGFLYSLATADKFVKRGRFERVLVVGGEVHSTGIDLTTRGREVGVIFGDGAAAVIVGPSTTSERGILSTHLHADGNFAEKLWLEYVAARDRPRVSAAVLADPDAPLFPKMEGRYVFKHAVTRLPEVITEALSANGYTIDDLTLLIPHQANIRINQAAADVLGLPQEKVFNNIQRYGNTTAASIPIALYEALEGGLVRAGDLICLAAFGAGFTWAAVLIRW